MLDMFAIVAEGETATTAGQNLISWASGHQGDLNAVLDTIVGLAPTLLPVAVGCLAFRKGIGFIFSVLRGA